MNKPKTVTSLQLSMSIGTAIIGVGILAFPRITVEYVNTGAPFSAFFGMLLMIVGGFIVAHLGRQYQNQTIFEYAETLIGKYLGKFFVLLIGMYFLELAALASREFGEVIVTSVLQHTPIAVTVFVMVFLATIASRVDIAVFVRILTFYMPFVYFPALIIVVLSLKSARLSNLQPLFAFFFAKNAVDLTTSVMVVAALFTNFLIVGLVVPFMYHPERAPRSTIIGIATAGSIYIILMYGTLAVFGIEEIRKLLWPTLELAKTAALPAFFVERLDPIFLAVWVTAVFSAIFAAYYMAVQAFAHLLKLRDHRSLSIILLPFILTLAKQPPNIVAMYRVVKHVGIIGLIIILTYVFLLFIMHITRLKKRRTKR